MLCASLPVLRHRRRARPAFTLLELLVVIGIIALLIALLMPAFNRVREQGRQVTCLSKMRSITQAILAYTMANENVFPTCAAGNGGVGGNSSDPADWIYWQTPRCPNSNLAYGAIVKYMGTNVPASNFICPSDAIPAHRLIAPYLEAYRYSYTVNFNICGGGYNTAGTGPKYSCLVTYVSMNRILNPSQKILLIDEDSQTIDDGSWAPQHSAAGVNGSGRNQLSNRHDLEAEFSTDINAGRGNAAFVDGHADFIPRDNINLPHYYDPSIP